MSLEKYLKTYFVSAFPGCGKTTFIERNPQVLDSDSSKFPKDNFPKNYLQHIQRLAIDGQPALISTHAAVREGLYRMGLAYLLVYPHIDCKAEYIERYKQRGSPETFIALLDKMWETWIGELMTLKDSMIGVHQIILQPGQYLSDVVEYHTDDQGKGALYFL